MNNAVRSFLSATDSKGVAACKGMGKTFLLKAKRLQLQEENNSFFLLPKNRLVDVPGTIIIDKMHRKFLSAYDNWINLWLGCISIYLLSLEEFSYIIPSEQMEEFPECVQNLLKREQNGIFSVLHQIISLKSKEELNEVMHSTARLFDYVQTI